MITKFKIYESWIGDLFSNKNEPQKGDYVICKRRLAINEDDPLYIFMSNHYFTNW